MKYLTPAEIREANKKGAAVARAAAGLERARLQLDRAFRTHVDQSSSRWLQLCDNQAAAIDQLNRATQSQTSWWRAKGFKV